MYSQAANKTFDPIDSCVRFGQSLSSARRMSAFGLGWSATAHYYDANGRSASHNAASGPFRIGLFSSWTILILDKQKGPK